MTTLRCPKCKAVSGDDWSQCNGSCPMVGSPYHYSNIRFRPRPETKRIILHSSHTGPELATATEFLTAQGRANGLLQIGYHAVIERDGALRLTRDWHVVGSHAASCNHDSIGICMVGGADLSDQQHIALIAIYMALMLDYGPLPVFGHDEVVRRRDKTHKCPEFDVSSIRIMLHAPNAYPQ